MPYKSVTHRKHWGQYTGAIAAPVTTFNVLSKNNSQTKLIAKKTAEALAEPPAIQEEIVENIEAPEEVQKETP